MVAQEAAVRYQTLSRLMSDQQSLTSSGSTERQTRHSAGVAYDWVGDQDPARYFVPGMATWPIAVGLIHAAVPGTQYRPWLAAALVGSIAVGLAINEVKIRPVLSVFNDEYRTAMTRGAEYLRETANLVMSH
jgi:hypothetical protein